MQEVEKYLPFFRKYRPQSFGEIVGQKHLIKALSTAIELNRIANAYLFCGPRGTGKTSTARIFAKSLNCSKGMTLEPCQTCPSCTQITNASGLDVIEIDAASNRGINEAKELISQVQYAPINGKFKIFIIDEVHMLSTDAFNALLKTFEEPPENVIFILATTEPHKVLETIVSRCQRYDFRRITVDDIAEKLTEVAKLEKIKITSEAIYAIAKYSNGGLRDSLALLDQVSVLGLSSEISEADIDALVGKISFKPMFELLNSILQGSVENSIKTLSEILESGSEPRNLTENFIEFLKNISVVLSSSNSEFAKKVTLFPEVDIDLIQKSNFELSKINSILNSTVEFYRDIKFATNPYLWVELMVVELCNLSDVAYKKAPELNISENITLNAPTTTLEQNEVARQVKPVDKIEVIETKPEEKAIEEMVVESKPQIVEIVKEELIKETENVSQTTNTVDTGDINYVWSEIVSAINGKFAQAFFKGVPLSVDLKDNILTVGFLNQNVVAQANSKMQALKEAVSNVLNPDVQIVFMQNVTGQKTISEPKIVEKKTSIIKEPPIPEESYLKEPPQKPAEDNNIKKSEDSKKADNYYSEKTKMYIDAFNGKVVD